MSHIENDSSQTLVTTAETPIGQFGSLDIPGQPYQAPAPVPAIISGVVNVTPGTTTSGVVIRVRQGSITGNVVGVTESDQVTAAIPSDIPFEANDQTGSVNGWLITATQTAATANGTVNLVSADANQL